VQPAPIRSAVCAYTVADDVFAWPGVVGANGRLTFTGGVATFVELDGV
jgi:hypothetical protein